MKLIIVLLLMFGLSHAQTTQYYYKKGFEKAVNKDHAGAIVEYTKAIATQNDGTISKDLLYSERAQQKYLLKDFKGAIIDYTKSIELDPTTVYYEDRAYCREELSDFKGAIDDYTKAIELEKKIINNTGYDRSFVKYYYKRGIIKIKIGERESGCTDLRKAVEFRMYPSDYEYYYQLIRKYCQ
jgi:tetratricopeptide (TPR) repeat protein